MNFVRRTFPHHLEENVKLDTSLHIDFFIDLNRQLLQDRHVALYNLTEEISEPITFEYRDRQLTIKPVNPLKPLMHYQVQILGGNDGIRDITGRMLAETYTFEFYTADIKEIKPPVLLSPTDLSVMKNSVVFRWEPVANAQYYEIQISKSNTFQNLVWPNEEVKIYETSVVPNIAYEKGQYYARIRSVDTNGVKSAFTSPIRFFYEKENTASEPANPTPKRIQLQTASRVIADSDSNDPLVTLQNYFSAQNTTNNTRLYIQKSTPKHQSLNLPTKSVPKIVIEFSEEVDPESITDQTIYLIGERN